MATDAASDRIRRPAVPAPAAHRPVRIPDCEGRTPHTSDTPEEFSYV